MNPEPVKPEASNSGPLLPEPADQLDRAGSPATALTPARVLLGRAGSSYRTSTLLALRADHAAARDALHEHLSLDDPAMAPLVDRFGLFEVCTRAATFADHLARPDLGRRLDPAAIERISAECPHDVDLQVVIGDGLSSAAVRAQVPELLPLLVGAAAARGLSIGRPVFVRHCRVGVLNDVGDTTGAGVVVLLVGERPGLATAESLSAYLAHRPTTGDTDAERNLISNIHAGGVRAPEAVRRILGLVEQFRLHQRSGFEVRESTSSSVATAR